MKIGIYSITFLKNNKIYIGSSSNILQRWSSHKSRFKNNKHTPLLQNNYNKYGLENIKFDILEECSVEDLIKNEQKWFDYYKGKSYKLLNYGNFVENVTRGVPLSLERKIHLSQKLKGKPNVNKGKKMSNEFRLKVSKSQIGRKMTQKNKEILKPYINRPKTNEEKLKFSIAKKMFYNNKIICIETQEVFDSYIDAARRFNTSYQAIRQSIIRNGKCKKMTFKLIKDI
jgi:group I intron endonuclease